MPMNLQFDVSKAMRQIPRDGQGVTITPLPRHTPGNKALVTALESPLTADTGGVQGIGKGADDPILHRSLVVIYCISV